jgi:butyryl-CoA dehydrogenase
MDEVMAGPAPREDLEGLLSAEFSLLAAAKKITLFAAGAATQRYADRIADEQEVMGAIANMVMEVYAMESAILRAEKISAAAGKGKGNAGIAVTMARVFAAGAIEKIELEARRVIAAAAEGDMARTQFTILRRLAKHDPANTVALRREIARYMVRAGRYIL